MTWSLFSVVTVFVLVVAVLSVCVVSPEGFIRSLKASSVDPLKLIFFCRRFMALVVSFVNDLVHTNPIPALVGTGINGMLPIRFLAPSSMNFTPEASQSLPVALSAAMRINHTTPIPNKFIKIHHI